MNMKRNLRIVALTVSLTLGSVAGAGASESIDGLVGLTPVLEHSVIAVEVQVTPDTPITGLRWYHNDANVVFPHVLLVEGELFQPPVLSETAVVLEDVGGASLAWSEILLPTPIMSSTGVVHVVFELPAHVERTGEGLGGGPALGYRSVAGGPRGYLSTGGDHWTRMSRSRSLAVEPITAMMRGAQPPVTLADSRGSVSQGWWTERGPTDEEAGDLSKDPGPGVSEPVVASLRAIPNPFNPRTEIAFAVAAAGEVSLEVFDVRGRKVHTLVKGPHEVGHYSVVWEGVDRGARAVASGVYYLRLQTVSGTLHESVVLLR